MDKSLENIFYGKWRVRTAFMDLRALATAEPLRRECTLDSDDARPLQSDNECEPGGRNQKIIFY